MSIPYPSSTDLVKDGATAMQNLATQVDNKSGLILLSTTSFSAVASVSLPANTFTTTYSKYLIRGSITSSGGGDSVNARLRASGTDNSSANYNWQYIFSQSTTLNSVNTSAGSTTVWNQMFGYTNGANKSYFDIELHYPAQTGITVGKTHFSSLPASNNTITNTIYTYGTTVTTAYDSLTAIAASGTISGTISVYALNE